ncbi:MAG: hypothetical protein ACHQIM_09180 [Sphingobacteriales bacterium]
METTISSLLKTIQKDKAVGPYPASLYAAMLTCWQEQGCRESFRVSRSILMPLSGIRSFATYHKCLGVLVQKGYIGYMPSHNNRLASKVILPGNNLLQTSKSKGGER